MKYFSRLLPAILLVIAGGLVSCDRDADHNATHLRVEYLDSPLSMNTLEPRFSWEIESDDPDFIQAAYEIRVSSRENNPELGMPDMWKSGLIKSGETNQIVYAGEPLKPNTTYFWTVRSWDQEKEASNWAPAQAFRTGHSAETWKAQWIGMPISQAPANDYTCPPSPMLRKVFKIEKPVAQAFLTASAKGLYEVMLNGKKIGDQYLAPGWTDYADRIQYQTYPISELDEGGEFCISALLADGWYAGRLGSIDFGWGDSFPWRGWYGRDLRFLAQLDIWYKDGSHEVISSDDTWKYYEDGPIREADHFIGVTYDFNKEVDGWMLPEFDDQSWKPVTVEQPDYSILKAQIDQPIEVWKELTPIGVETPKEGVYVVDMGQNMVGWLKVKIQGQPGDTIRLKHAEMLKDDGEVYRENLRNAPQIETYILSDTEEKEIEPLFTFHGFRYVQFEGLREAPKLENITGRVLVSATPTTADFSCSNPMLNKLYENIHWTQWRNQLSVPTDCPQRSERMGWMGDAQVFAQTAIFNHDMSAFYTKWGIDVMQAQFETGEFSDVSPRGMPDGPRFINAPGWADAGLIVPFRLYENYNDTRVIENHYESMKKYIDLIHGLNPDLIYMNGTGHAYNDWLNGNTIISDDYPKEGGEVPRPVFNTAFFIRSTRMLAQAADLTGRTEDAAKYHQLAADILKKWQESFLSEDGTITGETQAGYAMALNYDLVPEKLRPTVAKKMVEAIEKYDNRMSTGFVSTICMMLELSKAGYHELACQLAESHRLPSWGYSIDQGATTIWERWDAYVKGRGFQNAGMNSFNHYTFGSIGEWMYKHVLGIQPDPESPGWRHFFIAPQMGGTLTYANGYYHSINGRIGVDWKLNNGTIEMSIEIPANTTATFIMPHGFITEVEIDGEELKKINPDRKVELGSGEYFVILKGK